jgi:hypothetical protein
MLSVICLGSLLSSCGTPHPGLSNGSVSACYRAIPTALAAVHDDHATLIGVHRVAADQVKPHLPPAAQSVLAGDDDTSVCAVAFKGAFTAGQVQLAPPTEQGKYAVVLVTTRHLNVLTSAVLATLPKAFGKRTI